MRLDHLLSMENMKRSHDALRIRNRPKTDGSAKDARKGAEY